MALISTPGAANANSYEDVSEADAFNASRPQADAWTTLTTAQKEAALEWATSLIDAIFQWTGVAASSTQALCWPRVGMLSKNGFPIANNVIPDELKRAVAEYARQLAIDDKSADNDPLKQGITGIKAGSVSLMFKSKESGNDVDVINAMLALEGSDFFYLAKSMPDAVRILIPRSWYTARSTTKQPIFFGVHR